jgi:hypothetical protein
MGLMYDLLNPVLAFLCAGGGAYLGSYLKKKGENLATHEDIDKLVKQVSVITEATKKIEAKISNEAWDRQKRWELKREVLFDVTKTLGPVNAALASLYAACETEISSIKSGGPERFDLRLKAGDEWNIAADRLNEVTFLAALVCGEDLRRALLDLRFFAVEAAQEAMRQREVAPTLSTKELVAKLGVVTAATRKELEIDNPA